MRKYSNDPINQIVYLGDGKYEFCYNHAEQTIEEEGNTHISYEADIVVCPMPVNRAAIIYALMEDGKTADEANDLTEGI